MFFNVLLEQRGGTSPACVVFFVATLAISIIPPPENWRLLRKNKQHKVAALFQSQAVHEVSSGASQQQLSMGGLVSETLQKQPLFKVSLETLKAITSTKPGH